MHFPSRHLIPNSINKLKPQIQENPTKDICRNNPLTRATELKQSAGHGVQQ